jgi:hypothetical protein
MPEESAHIPIEEGQGDLPPAASGTEDLEATIAELQQALAGRTAERDQAQQARLAAHRRALLAEHRGTVVEPLVHGDTIEELDASVARAREAYAQVADQLRTQVAGDVPAGNPARAQPSYEALSPQAKIAEALRRK